MKFVRFLALMLSVLLLTACGGGDISEVGRSIGECERFSKREVATAMDEVEAFFRREYDGCKLLRQIRYELFTRRTFRHMTEFLHKFAIFFGDGKKEILDDHGMESTRG